MFKRFAEDVVVGPPIKKGKWFMYVTKKGDIPSENACEYYDSGTCKFSEYCVYQDYICSGDIEPCIKRLEVPSKN